MQRAARTRPTHLHKNRYTEWWLCVALITGRRAEYFTIINRRWSQFDFLRGLRGYPSSFGWMDGRSYTRRIFDSTHILSGTF